MRMMMMIMCISMLGRADSDERVFRSWLETAETLSRQLRLVTHHFSQARTSRRSVSGIHGHFCESTVMYIIYF